MVLESQTWKVGPLDISAMKESRGDFKKVLISLPAEPPEKVT
jgi:hypothetical protein